jgi:hypothetical protein
MPQDAAVGSMQQFLRTYGLLAGAEGVEFGAGLGGFG